MDGSFILFVIYITKSIKFDKIHIKTWSLRNNPHICEGLTSIDLFKNQMI